jgi:hypothetical protein
MTANPLDKLYLFLMPTSVFPHFEGGIEGGKEGRKEVAPWTMLVFTGDVSTATMT